MEPSHQLIGGVALEIRKIKTPDGAILAMSRIKPKGASLLPFPVILVHGSYSNRGFWISKKGEGLGPYLADQGFDVWIPELRGHGLSPKGPNFSAITAEDQIRHDLPAIQTAVHAITGAPCFWIGHSFGGLFVIASLSAEWMRQDMVRGLVTFGSQISFGDRYLKMPPVAWTISAFIRIMGHFPAPRLGLGPETEPAGAMRETIRWKQFRGRWATAAGRSYWDGLSAVSIPVLTYAAAGDKNDPPAGCRKLHKQLGGIDKMFIVLGRDNGFSKNFNHTDMVVSKEARLEVWPDMAAWMLDRT